MLNNITVAQQNIDQKNSKKLYKIACKGWTKTVVKGGIKQAITAAISSSGFPNIAIYASTISGYIYDAVCDYYGPKYD